MNILIACEQSGVIRRAFKEVGVLTVYSCDLEESEDNSAYHIQKDAREVIKWKGWDLLIAHPPCPFLCNSGVRWLHPKYFDETGDVPQDEVDRIKERFDNVTKARDFFMLFMNAKIPKICIENPVPHPYSKLPKYSQTVQPYDFKEDASKRTCLWLKGLPCLTPTGYFPPRIVNGKKRWGNQTDSGQNKLPPSVDRAKLRARTYEGIAKAMAEQWV